MGNARIIGSGSFLPEKIVSNEELAATLNSKGIKTSDEWIVQRTGICQRHLADNITNSYMAGEAAKLALLDAELKSSELDMIIVATSTPDNVFPSTACLVQANIKAYSASAFDIQAACSGFVYALSVANSFISSGFAKNIMVIGSEIFSRIIDWNDRKTCVLFGDGAGAFVLSESDSLHGGILSVDLQANGDYSNILRVGSHFNNSSIVGDPFIRMDGQAVFKQAINFLEISARNICKKSNFSLGTIDWFIPHQANIRIMNALGHKLGVPTDKFIITVDKHANTSAASIPLAFDYARKDGKIKEHDVILMQGVGGGFTCGSILAMV
ncbi:MAG: ketoacyl-ACP synthase III [Candidatus Kinetoplastibacterium crithidii]|nr:ketoacyl-ACP synthase III [Candidatus Kinetoplastibacterium crithidii]